MLKEILEKIEQDKPKTEDNSEVSKGELGVNGKKPVIKED